MRNYRTHWSAQGFSLMMSWFSSRLTTVADPTNLQVDDQLDILYLAGSVTLRTFHYFVAFMK